MSNDSKNEFETIDDLPEDEQKALRAAIDGNPILTLPAEFDHFDPVTDEVPIYELRNVARRARVLLGDTNQEQIRSAVEFAEIVTSQALIDATDDPRPLPDKDAAAFTGSLDELRPTALFRRKEFLDRSNLKPPAGMTWFKVFASLALAYVARSINTGVNHGIEAADALAKAEVLSNKSRAGRTKPIDDHFIRLLDEYIHANPGLSGSEYARRFTPLHSQEMRNRHGREYDERTVAKCVSPLYTLYAFQYDRTRTESSYSSRQPRP